MHDILANCVLDEIVDDGGIVVIIDMDVEGSQLESVRLPVIDGYLHELVEYLFGDRSVSDTDNKVLFVFDVLSYDN